MAELRQKFLAGDKPIVITRNFGVALSAVYYVEKLFNETGDFSSVVQKKFTI